MKVMDLREPPWHGTTILDIMRYEITDELPQSKIQKKNMAKQ